MLDLLQFHTESMTVVLKHSATSLETRCTKAKPTFTDVVKSVGYQTKLYNICKPSSSDKAANICLEYMLGYSG